MYIELKTPRLTLRPYGLGDFADVHEYAADKEDNRTRAELGWTLNKRFRGNGYITEAAKAIMEYAINELHVIEVFAHCDTRNTPSANVMKRLGMVLESEGDRHYDRTGEDAREYKYTYVPVSE